MSELQYTSTVPGVGRDYPFDGLLSPSKSEITGKVIESPADLEVHRSGGTEKFFILGCPRSGTTMLQQALNRHSQIVIPPETKFFFYFYRQSHRQQLRHLKRLNEDLGIDIPPPSRRIRTVEESRAFFEDMSQRYLSRLGRTGVTLFGEKTPEHTSRVHYIRELYPDAKIIFILRDGRDVALSLSRVPWLDVTILGGFLIWLYYCRFAAQLRRQGVENVSFVRYEDLVTSPRPTISSISKTFGVEYDDQMAIGFGNFEGIPRREFAWKQRSARPITASRANIWRRELTSPDVALLEAIGGRALESLGYELSTRVDRRTGLLLQLRFSVELARLAARLPIGCTAGELFSMIRRSYRSEA